MNCRSVLYATTRRPAIAPDRMGSGRPISRTARAGAPPYTEFRKWYSTPSTEGAHQPRPGGPNVLAGPLGTAKGPHEPRAGMAGAGAEAPLARRQEPHHGPPWGGGRAPRAAAARPVHGQPWRLTLQVGPLLYCSLCPSAFSISPRSLSSSRLSLCTSLASRRNSRLAWLI